LRLFSLEEMNIIEMYRGKTKEITIHNMRFAAPYMDKHFRKMTMRIIEKINLLTEDDFVNLLLFTVME
jgi:hypothetical protein